MFEAQQADKAALKAGCYLKRHGSKHDIYANLRNGRQAPIPRHSEIKDSLVNLVLKQLGIEKVEN